MEEKTKERIDDWAIQAWRFNWVNKKKFKGGVEELSASISSYLQGYHENLPMKKELDKHKPRLGI